MSILALLAGFARSGGEVLSHAHAAAAESRFTGMRRGGDFAAFPDVRHIGGPRGSARAGSPFLRPPGRARIRAGRMDLLPSPAGGGRNLPGAQHAFLRSQPADFRQRLQDCTKGMGMYHPPEGSHPGEPPSFAARFFEEDRGLPIPLTGGRGARTFGENAGLRPYPAQFSEHLHERPREICSLRSPSDHAFRRRLRPEGGREA